MLLPLHDILMSALWIVYVYNVECWVIVLQDIYIHEKSFFSVKSYIFLCFFCWVLPNFFPKFKA